MLDRDELKKALEAYLESLKQTAHRDPLRMDTMGRRLLSLALPVSTRLH